MNELKAAKLKRENRTRLLHAQINYYLTMQNYHVEDLAIKLGMSRASLYAKMKDATKFTLDEFCKLCFILQLDDETKLKLVA